MIERPDEVRAILRRVMSAGQSAFEGSVRQLFNALSRAKSDNAVYAYYQQARGKWKEWPGGNKNSLPWDWQMPDTYEDSKSLAYDLYASLIESKGAAESLPMYLYGEPTVVLNQMSFNRDFGAYLDEVVEEILSGEGDGANAPTPTTRNAPENISHGDSQHRRLFVISGRNESLRTAMFAFLRSLGLDPLEWPHVLEGEPEPNPDIEHTVSQQLTSADAVLCLLTPDDIAYLRPELQSSSDPPYEREPTPQPRLNVVFELGMAMQWDSKRTVLIRLGELRPISDVGGRHIPRFTGELKSRQDLARRLKKAGLDVNDTGTDWHTEGDFGAAIAALESPIKVAVRPADSDENKRLDEIASEAADGFEKWRTQNFGKKPVGASLVVTWIESGWTTEFHDFAYDTLQRMVVKLRGRGHTELTCPTKREFDGALQKWHSRPRQTRWVQPGDMTY
jgi:predicted nucleotide-binding protein